MRQFQQTVQHFQQQQDHVQAQALIHQHHSSHAPLPPSLVSSSKSIAVMPLPQHLSKIPLAPVLQQGIAVHEERNGAGVTSSRVNEGSAGSSHCEDASIQQVESGELRGSCSNGRFIFDLFAICRIACCMPCEGTKREKVFIYLFVYLVSVARYIFRC